MYAHSPSSADLPPAFALRRLIFGHRVTEMIAVATRLNLADLLGDSAQTAVELAAQLAVTPDALHRLLRALACWIAVSLSRAISLRLCRPAVISTCFRAC